MNGAFTLTVIELGRLRDLKSDVRFSYDQTI